MKNTGLLVVLVILLIFSGVAAYSQKSIVKAYPFDVPSVGFTSKYTAILPDNYYKDSQRKYPVLYLLHGHSGNYTSWITYAKLPIQLATNYNCIIILPDGGNSWYVNWTGQTDGKKHQWEDGLVNDLIPIIDKKFRTINNKKSRFIGGLSMGGFGALALGLKNPDKFGFVFSSAGVINFCQNIKREMAKDTLDWNSPQLWSDGNTTVNILNFSTQKERTPQGLVFKTAKDADVYDPYLLLQNFDSQDLPYVHIDVGNNDDFLKDAFQFVDSLKKKTKNYSFITFTGEHEVPYWQESIEHTFLIMKQQKFVK